MSLSKNNTNKTNQHLATKAKEGGKKTVKIATCNKYHKLDTSQKKKKKKNPHIHTKSWKDTYHCNFCQLWNWPVVPKEGA